VEKTRKIDFATLGLKDAIDLAVLIEEEAKDRYGEFADSMEMHHTPVAAKFFRFMQGVETMHEDKLLLRRTELFGNQPRTVTREMIYDIEAPETHEPRVFMTARQALAVAMEAEKKAYAFFAEALQRVTDAGVKELFTELREEEEEHQRLVQKQIDKLAPEDAGDIRDYEDPPVMQ
jgi:rubrerythrin